jgi:hypothetical protein
MADMAEHLLSKHKMLNSNPSVTHTHIHTHTLLLYTYTYMHTYENIFRTIYCIIYPDSKHKSVCCAQ